MSGPLLSSPAMSSPAISVNPSSPTPTPTAATVQHGGVMCCWLLLATANVPELCYGFRPVGQYTGIKYPSNTSWTWMEDVRCTGTEQDIGSCKHQQSAIIPSRCDDYNISVSCAPLVNGKLFCSVSKPSSAVRG